MSTPFSKLVDASKNQPNDCDGWRDKLVGKVILKDDVETTLSEGEYVRTQDLPKLHRVLPPNSMATMDFRPDRLNVQVDHSMRCTGVNYG
ncbi:uncharacterized protein B0P05DRAFT_538790 [Gilbertella persicaria]|uniref:uncharacterized protein n=1 Tax=Gilbertella persicaria TaxID=101096 RepID=UPI00221EB202|nr:uncharacterized protein B0P05DRAFT_538790 [Gilbertella persicaria]KAI8081959.1 hypothetical protein B0P05DRAFT_538790 [Gilbertella persicaria]